MNGKYDKTIDQYIPEGVNLTEVQQGYLSAVVELSKKQETVRMIEVAHHMNKSTSAVSSAMKTLSSKGVLKTDVNGEIKLLLKKTLEKKSSRSSTKKSTTSQVKARKSSQEADNSPKKEPKIYVTANELIDSFAMNNFKGIHEVKDGSEWISCNGFWAINVPAGFSYTMDTTKTGKSAYGGKCDLEIQLTNDADFKSALKTPFSLAIYSEALMVPLADNSDDLCSAGMMKSVWALKELFKTGNYKFETAVYTSDVAVIYLTQRDNTIKEDHLKISFFIVCSGSGLASFGETVISGKKIDELLPVFTQMLRTIKKIPQDRCFHSFYSPALPAGYELRFNKRERFTAANGDDIPVPDGYKWSIDQSVINTRSFSIVPNDATFWNGVGDQSKTRIDLSGMMFEIGGVKQAKGMFATVAQHIATQLPENVMESNVALHLVKLTSEGGIFIQQNADKDNMTNVMIRALKIAPNDAKLYTVRIYFPKKIPANMVNKTVIECRRFASCWFSHFMYTSDLCDYGNISLQPILGAPEELHEHYDLINSGTYSTHRDADFVGQPISKLLEEAGNTQFKTLIADDHYDLDQKALTIAQIFRMKEHKFDPYHDTEAFIQLGMIEKVDSLHKLRSFAWGWAAEADSRGTALSDVESFHLYQYSDYDYKKWQKDRITLNYNDKKYFPALCNQYDWHVFYVPDTYLYSEDRQQNDLRFLCGKENRGGNTVSFAIPGLGVDNLDKMQRNNAIISRNEETLASLESLRNELMDLLPVMEMIHDEFLESRNRVKPLTGYLAEVLAAWCALCVSAREPFYSEEASDTPEANAALSRPMSRPSGIPNNTFMKKTGTPENELKEVHLDLHGAKIVEESEFEDSWSELGDILILPEGLVEIKLRGFAGANIQEVRLPKSLRIIGPNAFFDNRNLETVTIPDGVIEISCGAFGKRNELTDIYLPNSLKKLDRCAFYEADGKKEATSHITVHMSAQCAKNLQIVSMRAQYGPSHSVAKAFIIDGKSYATIEEYKAEVEKEERVLRERQRQEEEKRRMQLEETKKAAQRESLKKEVLRLTDEMNAIKGLFSGMKKKKIQKLIDELQERINRI